MQKRTQSIYEQNSVPSSYYCYVTVRCSLSQPRPSKPGSSNPDRQYLDLPPKFGTPYTVCPLLTLPDDGPLSQRAAIPNGWWMSIFFHKTTEIRNPICTVHTARRAKPCAPCSHSQKWRGTLPEYMAPAPLQLGVKYFRPRRSRSAAAYSRQTFPWTICRSVRPSVYPVHCGKTVDRIRMSFGNIGRTGPGMRQIVGFGGRSTGRIYGVRVRQRRDAALFPNYFRQTCL